MPPLCPTAAAPSPRAGLRHAESRTTATCASNLTAWLLPVFQLAHGYAHLKEFMKVMLYGPTYALFPGSAPALASDHRPNCPLPCLHRHFSTKEKKLPKYFPLSLTSKRSRCLDYLGQNDMKDAVPKSSSAFSNYLNLTNESTSHCKMCILIYSDQCSYNGTPA